MRLVGLVKVNPTESRAGREVTEVVTMITADDSVEWGCIIVFWWLGSGVSVRTLVIGVWLSGCGQCIRDIMLEVCLKFKICESLVLFICTFRYIRNIYKTIFFLHPYNVDQSYHVEEKDLWNICMNLTECFNVSVSLCVTVLVQVDSFLFVQLICVSYIHDNRKVNYSYVFIIIYNHTSGVT